MAEVTAILNARPLVPVSNDPENPSNPKAIPGTDGRVRKVELKTANQGQSKTYLRPVTKTV